jgi:hypothetical protein
LTSNVTDEDWPPPDAGRPILPFAGPAGSRPAYSSTMCSNDSAAGLAARLGTAIDELAAVAVAADQPADPEVAARLAAAWALIADADPELADRAARYSG